MMEPVVAILMLGFFLLLALDVPIAVSIAMATFLGVLAAGYDPGYLVAMKLANGIDSFPLLAIPFFIVSGLLMGQGGVARRLMDFASALVGSTGGSHNSSTPACPCNDDGSRRRRTRVRVTSRPPRIARAPPARAR